MRPLRLAMVGGGAIAGVHRAAARLDGEWNFVAGMFSRDRERNAAISAELNIAPGRSYESLAHLIEGERARPDGAECVAVVAPNDAHAPAALECLDAGLDVICEKPMALTVVEAEAVAKAARSSSADYFLVHNYSAYPMTLEAANRVKTGALGPIRLVAAEFANGSRSVITPAERDGAEWWADPARGGDSFVLGNLGSHVFHLINRVTGLHAEAVSARLSRAVPGRRWDDTAQIVLRLQGGAEAAIWLSMAAPGNGHGLRLRVFGEQHSLDWQQELGEQLLLRSQTGPLQTLRRGEPWLSEVSRRSARTKAGQSEGFIEAMANIYRDVAEHIRARRDQRPASALAISPASPEEGLATMQTIAAAIGSNAAGGRWTDIAYSS